MNTNGPRIRSDIAELYIARPTGLQYEFLQLRRTTSPMRGTWQPVMGHIEQGESAIRAIIREALEETGFDLLMPTRQLYQLEQSNPYFLASRDEIIIPPRFLAIVESEAEPTLNDEHDGSRWAPVDLSPDLCISSNTEDAWFWPSQRAAIREAALLLANLNSQTAAALKITSQVIDQLELEEG